MNSELLTTCRIWALKSVLTVFALSGPGASGQLEDASPAPGPPPSEIRASSSSETYFLASSHPKIGCSVSFSPSLNELLFWFAHSTTGGMADVVAGRTEAVDFVPTAVAFMGSRELLVAGKFADGRTVIERCRVPQAGLEGAGGDLAIRLSGEVARERVLELAEAGRSVVQAMSVTLGTAASRRAFVLFHDSRELYSLDLESRSLSLVASPNPGAKALHVPALKTRLWRFVIPRERAGEGFAYQFDPASDIDRGPSLFLFDADKDGTVDRAELISSAEWETRNYSNPKGWTTFFDEVP